jgi:hypothetical protein
MIKVNFSDGTTLAFDLNRDDDHRQWAEWSLTKDFQNRITGIGILHDKKFHTLQYPKNFRNVKFYAEAVFNEKTGQKRKLGERLVAHADHVKLELLVYTYLDPPPPIQSRTTMSFVGRQMFPDARYEAIGGEVQ